MENSWQIKCGSTFPSSSTPSMAPSSMDHRDQVMLTVPFCFSLLCVAAIDVRLHVLYVIFES